MLKRLLAVLAAATTVTATPCGLAADSLDFTMRHILELIVANLFENGFHRERCVVNSGSSSTINYENNQGERVSFAIYREDWDDDFRNDHPYRAYFRGLGETSSHSVSIQTQDEFEECEDMMRFACFVLDQIESNVEQATQLYPPDLESFSVVPCTRFVAQGNDFNMQGILKSVVVNILANRVRKKECSADNREGKIFYKPDGEASREKVYYSAYIYEADDDWAIDDPYNYETASFGSIWHDHSANLDEEEYYACLDLIRFACFTLDSIEDNINQALLLHPQ